MRDTDVLYFEEDDKSELGVNGKQVFVTKRINGKTEHNKKSKEKRKEEKKEELKDNEIIIDLPYTPKTSNKKTKKQTSNETSNTPKENIKSKKKKPEANHKKNSSENTKKRKEKKEKNKKEEEYKKNLKKQQIEEDKIKKQSDKNYKKIVKKQQKERKRKDKIKKKNKANKKKNKKTTMQNDNTMTIELNNIRKIEDVNNQKSNKTETRGNKEKNGQRKQYNKNEEKNEQRKKYNKNNEEKQYKKKKKKSKKIKIFISLILLIIALIIFALVSPIFNIQEIVVYGNETISTETILSLSGLQTGKNIFQNIKSDIISKIKENAYIEEVTVKRILPGTIEIIVEEREVAYQVNVINSYVYLDYKGYILETSSEKADVPILSGISTSQDTLLNGQRLEGDDITRLNAILKIVNNAKELEIYDLITEIIVEENEYILYLESEKKYIYLGDDSNITNKMMFAEIIIENEKGNEGYVMINGDLDDGFDPYFREESID